jgi:hypothetical protein
MSKARPSFELRSAIAGLNIKKPYDLRNEGRVQLKRPLQSESQPPPTEVATSELPLSQAPRIEAPQTEKALSKVVQPQLKQSEGTLIEPPHNEEAERELVAPQAPRELKKPQGYFRLAHSVFWEASLRKLPGDAFRIFLWMSTLGWRFEASDGELRASVSFIANGTGVSTATVSRCLLLLKEEGLIELREVNYRRGNRWWVKPLAAGAFRPGSDSGSRADTLKNEQPRSESAQSDAGPSSFNVGSILNSGDQLNHSENEGMNSFNAFRERISNSLSSGASKGLELYLAQVRPARKRESEERALSELLNDYVPEEIERALHDLLARGIPGSGERSHSPLVFLSHGMQEVWQRVVETKRHMHRNESQERERNARVMLEQQEHAESEKRNTAFQESLPSELERRVWVERARQKLPQLDPEGPVIRGLAVQLWWEHREKNLKSEGTGVLPGLES